VVAVQLTGPLSRPWACRLVSALAFPLPPVRGSLEAAFIVSLCSPAAAAILGCFTRGAVRYRIAWAGGGHRRAVVWRLAQAVAARAPQLRNDPTGSNWEVRVTEHADGTVQLRLVPRFADTRFAYRVRDVPAASHPTLAAALALVAGVRADDVVWDPFVGSGTELIERARLGPCAALIGTDSDPRALAAAGVNLAAAGLVASLSGGDACSQPVTGVTLILCNPPMGRRVHRGDVAPLLERFLAHAARRLRPGGRLVWISPLPGRTLHWARRAGLVASYRQPVDMGGFSAEIQRFDRPERG
jgi:23S rRNA G2445 N2-methylase RlmL